MLVILIRKLNLLTIKDYIKNVILPSKYKFSNKNIFPRNKVFFLFLILDVEDKNLYFNINLNY